MSNAINRAMRRAAAKQSRLGKQPELATGTRSSGRMYRAEIVLANRAPPLPYGAATHILLSGRLPYDPKQPLNRYDDFGKLIAASAPCETEQAYSSEPACGDQQIKQAWQEARHHFGAEAERRVAQAEVTAVRPVVTERDS